jgi:THO complex subunit 2
MLPYSTRYELYRDWRGSGLERAGMMGNKPLLQIQHEMEAGKAARYTLKRLSKDNVRDMGRQVSKVTHSNPLVVFATILNQIESYDNLIQMMVETVRFVTPLSLDVLGYCVLSRLSGATTTTTGGGNRSRLKGMYVFVLRNKHCRSFMNAHLIFQHVS